MSRSPRSRLTMWRSEVGCLFSSSTGASMGVDLPVERLFVPGSPGALLESRPSRSTSVRVMPGGRRSARRP